jgi:hypothetical protein
MCGVANWQSSVKQRRKPELNKSSGPMGLGQASRFSTRARPVIVFLLLQGQSPFFMQQGPLQYDRHRGENVLHAPRLSSVVCRLRGLSSSPLVIFTHSTRPSPLLPLVQPSPAQLMLAFTYLCYPHIPNPATLLPTPYALRPTSYPRTRSRSTCALHFHLFTRLTIHSPPL